MGKNKKSKKKKQKRIVEKKVEEPKGISRRTVILAGIGGLGTLLTGGLLGRQYLSPSSETDAAAPQSQELDSVIASTIERDYKVKIVGDFSGSELDDIYLSLGMVQSKLPSLLDKLSLVIKKQELPGGILGQAIRNASSSLDEIKYQEPSQMIPKFEFDKSIFGDMPSSQEALDTVLIDQMQKSIELIDKHIGQSLDSYDVIYLEDKSKIAGSEYSFIDVVIHEIGHLANEHDSGEFGKIILPFQKFPGTVSTYGDEANETLVAQLGLVLGTYELLASTSNSNKTSQVVAQLNRLNEKKKRLMAYFSVNEDAAEMFRYMMLDLNHAGSNSDVRNKTKILDSLYQRVGYK